jgi:drug/metabolite transporter (DMT)-like permease
MNHASRERDGLTLKMALDQTRSDPRDDSRGLSATDLGMLLVVVIWGANFAIVKASLAQIPPLAFTALRFGVASLLLLPLTYAREGTIGTPRASLWKFVGLGLVGNTIYQLLFIIGLSHTTAANSALLIATTPVLVALLGGLLGVERVTRHVALGIALAFVGITLVVAARGVTLSRRTLGGDLLVFASAFCWALYTLGVRAYGAHVSPLRITTLTMLTGTPGLLLAGAPQLMSMSWRGVGMMGWAGLAFSSVLSIVVGYAIWNTSVRAVGSSRTAIYACATPLVAALVAWPLLGERFVALQAAGAALIVVGVLLARRRAKETTRAPVESEIHVSA